MSQSELEKSVAEASQLKSQMDREQKRSAKCEQRYLNAAATLAEQLTTAEEALESAVAKHQVQ